MWWLKYIQYFFVDFVDNISWINEVHRSADLPVINSWTDEYMVQ